MSAKNFSFSQKLLSWYDHHARTLPWRVPPPQLADNLPNPYHVWLSESMLQQTTVKSVIAYFHKFVEKWPSVQQLALADRDDVLTAWAGLGYYARARNLHACAKQVLEQHNGHFPDTEDSLRQLSGIGEYTAAAITSIAFGKRAVVVDGNIQRIISRYFTIEQALPASKPIIYDFTDSVTPVQRAGDFAQAMMDLGSTICTPKSPECGVCPVQVGCKAFEAGTQTHYPKKAPKKERPLRFAWVFIIEDETGHTLIQQRPDKGLLGGMWEFPSSDWKLDFNEDDRIIALADLNLDIKNAHILKCPPIKHTFTHFDLLLHPVSCTIKRPMANNYYWVNDKTIDGYALPTLMTKVWKAFKKYHQMPSLFD